MTCPVCKYQWCWVCGFAYKSVFHYMQFGSLICEMIGGIFLGNKSKCCRVTLFLTFTIFLPVLMLLASWLITGGGLYFVFEYLFLKDNSKFKGCCNIQESLRKISKINSIIF